MNVYSTSTHYGIINNQYTDQGIIPMNVHKQFEFIVDQQVFNISKLDFVAAVLSECKVSWDFYSMGDGYLKCLLWVNCDADKNISYYVSDIVHTILQRYYV